MVYFGSKAFDGIKRANEKYMEVTSKQVRAQEAVYPVIGLESTEEQALGS